MLRYSYRYVRPKAIEVSVSLQMKFARYLVQNMKTSLRDVINEVVLYFLNDQRMINTKWILNQSKVSFKMSFTSWSHAWKDRLAIEPKKRYKVLSKHLVSRIYWLDSIFYESVG